MCAGERDEPLIDCCTRMAREEGWAGRMASIRKQRDRCRGVRHFGVGFVAPLSLCTPGPCAMGGRRLAVGEIAVGARVGQPRGRRAGFAAGSRGSDPVRTSGDPVSVSPGRPRLRAARLSERARRAIRGAVKIAVSGPGGIGSTFAFQLARAGHEVTVVARTKRLAQLQRDGARRIARLTVPQHHAQVSAAAQRRDPPERVMREAGRKRRAACAVEQRIV